MINYIATRNSRSSRLKLFASLIFISVVASILFSGGHAKAATLNPDPGSTIPAQIRNYLANYAAGCNASTPKSPAIATWVSAAGNAAQTTITVPYGTTAIPIKFHQSLVSCNHTVGVGVYTQNPSSFSNSTGTTVDTFTPNPILGLSPPASPGTYTQVDSNQFFFRKSAGFTTSGTYSLFIGQYVVNRWNTNPNTYQCAYNGKIITGLNYSQCQLEFRQFDLKIKVTDVPPIGNIDAANCSQISGWTFDFDRPGRSIYIEITINGVVRFSHRAANVSRPDVNAQYGITGNHGFKVLASDYNSYLTKPSNTISIKAFGVDSAGDEDGRDANLGTRNISLAACDTEFDLQPLADLVISGPNYNDAIYTEHPNKARLTAKINQLILTPRKVNDVEWEVQFYAQRYISDGVFGPNIDLNCNPGARQDKEVLPAVATNTVKVCEDTNIRSLSLKAGDKICGYLTINPGSGEVDVSGTITSKGPAKDPVGSCQIIRDLPYLNFFGGDVYVGGGFNDGFLGCNNQGDINTFFNSADPANSGSSAQFAATAMRNVDQFRTANLGATGNFASPPNGLTFANTPSDGDFGQGQCINNYWKDAAAVPVNTSNIVDINTLISGVHKSPNAPYGNVVIDSGSIGKGKQIVLYVDGSARIKGNINYDTDFTGGSLANDNEIPAFILIAKDNIYIDPNVTELNGIYIAQGYGDTTNTLGTIYTCADPSGSGFNAYPEPTTEDKSEPFQEDGLCHQERLTVYGTFVARTVKFLRTKGSLRNSKSNEKYDQSTSRAAETFIMSPEIYASAKALCSAVPKFCNKGNYNAITSLPPIL